MESFFFIMEFSEKDFLSDWALARPNCFASRIEPKKKKKKLVNAKVAKENFNLYLSYSHALHDILFFFVVNS